MARYRTYGQFDDQQASDGDMAFVRMVSRINPEQLTQGDVAYSQNGRMDNDRSWEPRKGVDKFSPALSIGSSLNLPFNLDDASPPTYDDGVINGVYGSGYIQDPVSGTGYIAVVTNNQVLLRNVDSPDPNADSIVVKYPDGYTINTEVEMLQALDKILIFRDSAVTWEWKGNVSEFSTDAITGADLDTTVAASVWIETDNPHSLSVGDWVTISEVGYVTTDPNGTYRVATIVDPNAFSYVLGGATETYTTLASPTWIQLPQFSAVTQVDPYEALSVDTTTDNTVVSDGIATVSETGHGRSEGDIVTIYDPGSSGLVEGDRYEINLVDANGYTFYAEVADGTFSVTIGGKLPVGGGYVHMPNSAWGLYHQGRLILPYSSSLDTGTSRDELIFSDIFDSDTFDPILHQLRFTSGSADKLIGAAPLFDDRLLVLCRRSIHAVSGVSGSLEDLTVQEITREVGCIARKSIVEVGASIMFLSDQGVYNISYGQELNLMANAIPLSEPIENYMRQINWEYASNAVAVYSDNRYFLAIPLGASKVNNAVFVYNFLNQGWESIDTFPDGCDINNLLVCPYQGRNRMFLVNKAGAIQKTDSVVAQDVFEAQFNDTKQEPIDGQLVTRRYTMGNMDIKRFSRSTVITEGKDIDQLTRLPARYQLEGKAASGGSLDIGFTTSDPDFENDIAKQVKIASGEDYNLKTSIRKRGYGLQMLFKTATAKIRGCTVDAILSSRNHIDRS